MPMFGSILKDDLIIVAVRRCRRIMHDPWQVGWMGGGG